MFGQIAKFLKILNSEVAPGQIAIAITLGMYSGFGPLLSLHSLLVFLLVCITRTNLSAYFLSVAGFSLLAFALDPVFLSLGETLLAQPGLTDTWTALYQSDVMRALRFNHTLVLGSFVCATILFVPVFLGSRWIILAYRERIMAWVNNLRLVKIVKASDLFQKYSDLGA